MDATELEKKISGTIGFFLKLGKSLFYSMIPFVLIRRLKSQAAEITGPYTFLTILAFFGLRMWHFFFLKRLVEEKETEIADPGLTVQTEQTTADGLHLFDFVGIPSWEDIIMLTIPYVITAAILAQIFRRMSQKLKIDFKIQPDHLIIYFTGFLVLALPLILIFTDYLLHRKWDLPVLFFVALYLFLVFRGAAEQVLKSKHVTFLLLSSLVIPAVAITSMAGTLWTGNYFFPDYENALSEKTVNRHVRADLFQVKLVDLKPLNEKMHWKILLKSNDTEQHSFQLVDKPGTLIYNEDTAKICVVEAIQGNNVFSAYEPTLLEVITSVPDTTSSDYYFADLCIIDRTEFDVRVSTVLIWKLGKNELFKSLPRSISIFSLIGRTLARTGSET